MTRDGVLDCGDGARLDFKWHDAHKPIIAEIAAERLRQVRPADKDIPGGEGWTPEHDDEHCNEEMACAAASYAIAEHFPGYAEKIWPWDLIWWKPSNARRNLIKAAALIVAEIERLDRDAMKQSEGAINK